MISFHDYFYYLLVNSAYNLRVLKQWFTCAPTIAGRQVCPVAGYRLQVTFPCPVIDAPSSLAYIGRKRR